MAKSSEIKPNTPPSTTKTHTTTRFPGVPDSQIVRSTPTKRNEWAISPTKGGIEKRH